VRRLAVIWVLLLLSLGAAAAPPEKSTSGKGAYVFAYFKEPGSQGIYLALSNDGYKFTPLNDGNPWLKPEHEGEIMRDVFMTRNPGGDGFRMVWTWGWRGSSLGYAESRDLITWSEQKEIPMMRDFPTVHNVWAPETYWDEARKQWLIIWSSSFTDRPEGHRIWAARTTDFVTFTKPEMFFDPGFVVIDATMFHGVVAGRQQWAMVFKDQTVDPLRYQVRWTAGPSPEGPWGPLSGPITESWSEGPSVLQVGDASVVYYDHYRAPGATYKGVRTRDWMHWESVNSEMQFPEHCKHGSFFRVSEAEAQRLLSRHDAPKP
jgi:hypothetical protein